MWSTSFPRLQGTFAFAIHVTDSTGAFDVPGNKVVDLTGSPTMLGENTFIPATASKLDPSTEYFIVITKTSGSATEIQATQSEQEDLVAETGLTVEDGVFSINSGSTWAVTSAATPEFAVKGEPTPATAPGASASLTVTPGDTEATLTWTAPASDGGDPITKYQYRVSVDGGSHWSPDWTDVPDADSDSDQADERTVTVTSLVNGTLHTFQVRAVNSVGSGSEAQATATPATTPGAPASLTSSAGDAQVTLTWTAPTSDGGAAITKYQYRVSVDGGTNWAPDWTDVPDGSDTGSDQADERSVTVTGLANGTLHTFQVRAVNSEGDGSEAQDTAIPTATTTAPGAPASLTATRGDTEVDLRWTPPASDGGAAITKYQYRVNDDSGTN